MKIFAFLERPFRVLSDGKLIRVTIAWVIRCLAALLVLCGLFVCIAVVAFGLKAGDSGFVSHSVGLLLGCLILALTGLAWGVLGAGIHIFRARSIEELGESHFTVLSVFSMLFRLAGEMTFLTYSILGVGGCLFVWLADINPFSALGGLGEMGMLAGRIPFAGDTGSGFIGGIEFAIIFQLVGLIGILFFYALAEATVVLVEIAMNTRGLCTTSANAMAAPAWPASAAPARDSASSEMDAAPVKVPASPACETCGSHLDVGSTFCGECGEKVG